MKNEQLEIVSSPPPASVPVTSLSILEAAVRGGINKDNVEVVERLVALRREENKEQAQRAFAQSFLALRRNMPEIYVDAEAKDNSGNVAYRYCSEKEISEKLEPVLLRHGFAMLAGQRIGDGLVTISITLIHEAGHQETREFSVHPGATNRMKDATAADTGSTTSAWRHLVMKMFGLKARLRIEDDARVLGEKITRDQAEELLRRVRETESNEFAFLKLAGVSAIAGHPTLEHYAAIYEDKYAMLDEMLRKKESRGR